VRLWPFGKGDKLNTVNLSGDMDDIELIEEIERTFGIEISDDEAEMAVTVGELEKLVRSKSNKNTKEDALWELLCRIVSDHSGHKGAIDRATTFFAENAKERQRNG
jgi:hypothetical protein